MITTSGSRVVVSARLAEPCYAPGACRWSPLWSRLAGSFPEVVDVVVVVLSVRSASAKLLSQLELLERPETADQGVFAPLEQLTELKPQEEIHGQFSPWRVVWSQDWQGILESRTDNRC
ncbi:hypothetical protein [Mycobacterium terramassiliense]|uniref:hypothetical protein n=1 Tax=Mycobacterium terramassiliense TaxID=1841859 RepID=UPI0012FFC295|nr:hypothetical protein [Mycobacterium terramassiliense]